VAELADFRREVVGLGEVEEEEAVAGGGADAASRVGAGEVGRYGELGDALVEVEGRARARRRRA
jgi:hypothetical protein